MYGSLASLTKIIQTSTILQFYENQKAYDQNRTIEKLTYLTIMYLPAALMAVCLPAL